MKIKHFLFFITSIVLLSSCGNSGDRELKEYVSSFIHENHSVAFFGKADLHAILNKAGYKNIPMIGNRIEDELKSFDKCIDIDSPIYFAVEGPFSTTAIPQAFYAFIDVRNADSLVSNLTKKGYDFDKEGDINYSSFGELTLGVKKDLAILVSKSKEGEVKDLLEKAFEMTTGDLSEGKVDEMLNEKGDLVLGMSIESMYASSDTQLEKLSEAKKSELKEMVADSYSQSTINFENGAVVIKSKNYFSEALKKRLFLKPNPKADIVNKLGYGDALVGFSLNFDMVKLQSLLNDFAPDALTDLAKIFNRENELMLLGEDPLLSVSNGQLGFVMVGEPSSDQIIPNFNGFVGLNKNGKLLAELAIMKFPSNTAVVNITKNAFCYYSSPSFSPSVGKRLIIPNGCENFGKKSMTGFINFEGKDLSSFDFEGGAKIISIIKYINIEVDEDGSIIYIKSKKGKENILKESVDFLIKELLD